MISGEGRAGSLQRAKGHASNENWKLSITGMAWAALDVLTAVFAAYLALRYRTVMVRDHAGSLTVIVAGGVRMFALSMGWFAVCLVFFSHSYGLYGSIEGRSGLHEQRMTLQATAVAGLLLCGTLFLTRAQMESRMVVLLTIIFTMIILCVRRAIWRSMVYARYREGIDTRNILIVGSGSVARALRNHLESRRHLGFRFRGFIGLNEQESNSGDPDVIGDLPNCLSLARGLFVDEIFFSVPAERAQVIRLVEEARTFKIDVRVIPDLYDGLAWNAPVEYVGQFPTIPLHRGEFPIGSFMLKRMLDLAISLVGLVFLAPLFLILAAVVALDSKGPIFYSAKRIGRKGRSFNCFKFRTMVQNADALKAQLAGQNERDGVLFKMSNDPRVTRVGRFLRKYSLDELPQLWNIVRGDMSLVGPRPPMAAEVEQYALDHLRRLDVLPGLTGLWQVEARQDPSFDSYISLDTAYVENWSLWLDLKILLRTVSVVFGGTGT
ncbi:sugar transferase [Terriglobus saanensis]|uniref:sugar transferase n=1 Tax=Terriglobus saanensis TaxID=870903 RepID=UPI0002D9413D|nr:sugar transferase [Terriglobus saanensis]